VLSGRIAAHRCASSSAEIVLIGRVMNSLARIGAPPVAENEFTCV
jgi:hypothetical protein